MRFFNDLLPKDKNRIFYKEPVEITKKTSKDHLAFALGATLYIPAVKEEILEIILNNKYKRLTSLVLCLEDSIPEDKVKEAEDNLVRVLIALRDAIKEKRCDEKKYSSNFYSY
jgi:Citrate lyase beta subunit